MPVLQTIGSLHSTTVRVLLVLITSVPLMVLPAHAENRTVTLAQAYELALKHHPSIAMLRERILKSEADRYRAWTPLKPTAAFNASFTHYNKEISLAFPRDFTNPAAGVDEVLIQRQNQFDWNLSLRVPLLVPGAYPQLGAAKKMVEAERLRTVKSKRDFLLEVARSYYAVVTNREVVTALAHKVEVDQKHLAAAKARFEVGETPRTTVLRAELVLTQDEQQLRTTTNQQAAARRQLAILLGLEGEIEVTRPEETKELESAERDLLAKALAARADYQATAVTVAQAEQVRKGTLWQIAPTLDLTWLYRWSQAQGFSGERGQWNLMLNLRLPIYDGGLRYADLKAAESASSQAKLARVSLAMSIEQEIVRLQADLESSVAGVVSARKSLDLAKTNADDMEASFEAGAAAQLDLLDANQRRLDAEIQLSQSLFQRALARLSLAHALGRFQPGE